MSKEKRIELIKKIQEERGTKIISYITTTRENVAVPMAMDSIRKIFDHIMLFNKPKSELEIDLFLYSNGGDGTVPWKLVTLIREYAKRFSVIVPFRAFSAATLTCLGADEILMHPMGMLGPTDPTVTNEFNPPNPNPLLPGQKLGISVEDVTAYIDLIKDDAGIRHEDELVQAFNKLADVIHPLALGNVKRSLSQSRMMAAKLLSLHMTDPKKQHEMDEIVDNLTTKLYYHGHPINRIEALQQVGIKTVKHTEDGNEKDIWDLYLQYEEEMKLEIPYIPLFDFIAAYPEITQVDGLKTLKGDIKLAYIESENKTDYAVQEYEIMGNKMNNIINTQPLLIYQGWKVEH